MSAWDSPWGDPYEVDDPKSERWVDRLEDRTEGDR